MPPIFLIKAHGLTAIPGALTAEDAAIFAQSMLGGRADALVQLSETSSRSSQGKQRRAYRAKGLLHQELETHRSLFSDEVSCFD